jgi:CheY-like chemotaxis protein
MRRRDFLTVEYQPEITPLDIGLPDIDDYEIAKRRRQNPQLKDLRLIALMNVLVMVFFQRC